ncbi:RHS repeat-associated core domain-containing protein [Pseudomonas putida]|uniref:RHS repeat-associated core domain-containing protein n=1 Tax=Pseudomonas putida TaxID=303 RepID=A0A2Z4RKT6_PSEPU|nr:RHS repeat-associated core domain-containing protein [Pseudomonas putida]AWY41597.1 RHS repeat-associated core domain-containing protein [Pseudomonas putida]
MPTRSSKTFLLGTDQQNSVLNVLDANRAHPIAYTPYGHRPLGGLLSLLGFNGELMDPLTGHYHLGNGYRPFSAVLMRFICPDSLSPFGEGGINAYSYCTGDPINQNDPTGHMTLKFLMAPPAPPPRPSNLGMKTTSKITAPKATPATPRRKLSDTYDASLSTKRKNTDSTKYDLIGYHGSTKEHANSLSTGLKGEFMGQRNGVDSGRGFYLTPDYKSAAGWASTSKRAETSTPQVYGVYIKNFNTLKLGRDYIINTELNPSLNDHIQIIIKESAYTSISIKAVQSKQKSIRLNSFEAPF